MTDCKKAGAVSRRTVLAGLGTAGVASVAGSRVSALRSSDGSAAAEGVGGSWPMVQYDLVNSGYNPDESGPTSRSGPVWSYESGGAITSTPVLSETTAYVADTNANRIAAIDRETGAQQWEAEFDIIEPRMALAGDTLYVPGTGIRAYDAETGTLRWSMELSGRAYDVKHRGDFVFVTGYGGAWAIDVTSQNVLWRRGEVETVNAGAALQDSTLWAVSTGNGAIRALSVGDGGKRWLRYLGGRIEGSPTVANQRVVVPTTSKLHALKHLSGDTLWTFDEPVRGSVVIADGMVYGVTETEEAVAVTLDDGSEVWRTGVAGGSTNDPVLVGDLLYVAGDQGRILALDPSDGAVRWRTQLEGRLAAGLAAAGGELYAGDTAGRLHALSPAGATPTPEPATTSPAGGGNSTAGTATGNASTATTTGGNGNGGGSDGGATETSSTTTPGFGLLSALAGAGVVGARYVQRRRSADE